MGITAGADTQETYQGDQNNLDPGLRRRRFIIGQSLNATEAHLRFPILTREPLVRFLLILIASWGVLSTTAVAVWSPLQRP